MKNMRSIPRSKFTNKMSNPLTIEADDDFVNDEIGQIRTHLVEYEKFDKQVKMTKRTKEGYHIKMVDWISNVKHTWIATTEDGGRRWRLAAAGCGDGVGTPTPTAEAGGCNCLIT
ncbi:hypothetical protein LXL04_025814 [Taraxacum kok-saghyz]